MSSIVEQETRLFCQAELARQALMTLPSTRYTHQEDPARATNCGIATAVLQENLLDHHTVQTERLQGAPPKMPSYGYNRRRFNHVVLRHRDLDLLIDPTYGQLFGLAGIDRNSPNTKPSDYPVNLSLVVDLNDPDQTLEPLVESLEQASRKEHAQKDQTLAPLRDLGKRTLLTILRSTYDPENYQVFELDPAQPNFESIKKIQSLTNDYRK